MNKIATFHAALLMGLLALAPFARAESLAQRVPADAIVYAEWQGGDALGKAYENSKLKKLLDVLNLPQLISQKFQEDMDKKDDAPEKKADAKLLQDLLTTVVKSPTGFYFAGLDFNGAKEPTPRGALFSRLGAVDAAKYSQQLTAIKEREKAAAKDHDPQNKVDVNISAEGEFLLIQFGAPTDIAKRLSSPPMPENLAAVQAYKDTLAHVDAATTAPAALVYANGEAILKLIDDAVAAQGGPEAGMWAKVSDAFHFDAIHSIAWAGNFDATGNWNDQLFIGLPAERAGIAAFFDNKPLADEVFKRIPKNATWAGAYRLDLNRIFQEIRDAVAKIDPQNGPAGIDFGLKQFFAFTGVDLQKDLLDNLTDTYVYYASPDAAGSSLRSIVITTKLVDAAKIETALTNLENTIDAAIAQREPDSKYRLKTQPMPAPDEKITAHVMTLPEMTPAWIVSGDSFYAGTSIAAIQAAIAPDAATKRGSITGNPQFAELMKKLSANVPNQLSDFSYADMPRLAAEIYPFVSQALSNELARNPDQKNPFVLPPLNKITPTLSPALAITWVDKDGFHYKSTGPIPFANAITPRAAAIAFIAGSKKAEPKQEMVDPAPTPNP